MVELIALFSALIAGWLPQPVATRASFRGLSAADAKVVWISGSRATVVRTTDGGTTWKLDSIAGQTALDLRDIHAFDATTAVAISAGEAEKGLAKIFRTTDGGATWSLVFTTDQKGAFLDAISFWDRQHGLVMGDPIDGKLYLLATDDGGATWSHLPADAFPPVIQGEAAFAASGTCLATWSTTHAWIATGGGATARVFHSSNRGRSWSVADTPVHSGDGGAAGIFSVAFTDSRHGVVVGGNYSQPKTAYVNVALSDDGGATWRAAAGPPAGYLSAVAYVPGTQGRTLVATGLVGTAISTDAGERWTLVDTLGYNAVAFTGADTGGWAVGDRGRISKWSGPLVALPVRKP